MNMRSTRSTVTFSNPFALPGYPGNLPKAKESDVTDMKPVLPKSKGAQDSSMNRPTQRSGVQVRERNGIWEVQVDGKFRGDYHQKEHALAAAALHKLSPR